MFVQLGNHCVTLHRIHQIESIYLKTSDYMIRRRYISGTTHDIYIEFKDEKKPLNVFTCKNRKEADRKLTSICKLVNDHIDAEEKMFDAKISHIEDKVNRIYLAPGMPGFIEAQMEYELHVT